MTTLAIDAISTTIPPAAIKQAGYVAVLQYLRVLIPPAPPVIPGYLAAGLGVGTIFETAAAESTLGAAQGQRDGQTAATQAQSIGQPPGTILFVNVGDFAATPAEIPAINAYWGAFKQAASLYRVGGYATSYIINQLGPTDPGALWWQNAMNDNGVPGNIVNPRTSLYQRVSPTLIIPGQTGQYDENVIISPLPWWGLALPPLPEGKAMLPCAVIADQSTSQQFLIWPDRTLTPIATPAASTSLMALCGQTALQVLDHQDVLNLTPAPPAP